jgi:CheY-like chemotaxis protein
VTIAGGALDGIRMVEPAGTTAVRSVPAKQQRAPVTPAQLGGRILLAEDSPDSRMLITHLLKRQGLEVTVVDDGRKAVDTTLASDRDGRPFDLIFMDMQMPVLDGYHATGELREAGYRGTIVALTAHAMQQDRARCLAAGCDGYLTKPVVLRDLAALLCLHLAESESNAAVLAGQSEPVVT